MRSRAAFSHGVSCPDGQGAGVGVGEGVGGKWELSPCTVSAGRAYG